MTAFTTIADRLASERARIAELEKAAEELESQAQAALFDGTSAERLIRQRDATRREIQRAQLLVRELETRLPAERKEQLEADLAEARVAEGRARAALDKIVAARMAAAATAERLDAERVQAYQDVERAYFACSRLHRQLREEAERYPELYADRGEKSQ